jgi:hypothetical protein
MMQPTTERIDRRYSGKDAEAALRSQRLGVDLPLVGENVHQRTGIADLFQAPRSPRRQGDRG